MNNCKIIIILCVCFFCSCEHHNQPKHLVTLPESDTLFYYLDLESLSKLDSLIGNRNINIIYVQSGEGYTFSFDLVKNPLTENEIFLINNVKRYLKIKDRTIPVIADIDLTFIKFRNKKTIDHTPMAGITVNGRGELLSFFSEEYKLK